MQIPSLLEIRQSLARKRYWEYVKYVHRGRWIAADYLILICNTVQQFLEGELFAEDGTEIEILGLSMPPQHGKSMTITETLPSWYLGKYPDRRVIEASYNEDFATKFGRRNKEKVMEFGKELFGIQISKSTSAMGEWELDNGVGAMLSRGIGGSITGNPADLIIIDDPVKNRQEAESKTYRDRVWDEWLNSIRTRLAAKGKTIVIMTRWHEDDLMARLIKNEGSSCYYLNIPCEAEENDPIGRDVGDPLGLILGKGKEWLEKFKKVYLTKEGSRVWQSLYQGSPTAEEGNLFKRAWFRFYNGMPNYFDEIIQSWDCTFKDSDGTDFVAGQVWGRIGIDYYLLDRWKERMNLPATMEAIVHMTKKWPRALLKLVEDKANGPAVIQMLYNVVPGLVEVNPDGGKIARAHAVSPAFESGHVYLPDAMIAPWVVEYMDEMCAFPKSDNDDEVDATTQALNRLIYNTDHHDPAPPPPTDSEEALSRKIDAHLDKMISSRTKGRFEQI